MLKPVEPSLIGELDASALARFASELGPCAVVDLETTGLAGDRDAEILEVGIVLLDPGGPEPRGLTSLVRPSRPVPKPIVRLTGIDDAAVADAPTLDALRPELAELLRGRAIVAHNADFERRFLVRFVAEELSGARFLDTQDLLAVTHPDAPDLRLESFTRALLSSEERHRAFADALDTARVMARVARGAERGEARYRTARAAFEQYAVDSPWLALLAKPDAAGAETDIPSYVEIGESREAPVAFDEKSIVAALRDEARGRRHFAGYRVREPQISLVREFIRNLADGGVLLLEGGTGVGKSLAYLAAVIPFVREQGDSERRRSPVVVSTRTKLLQDQLVQKDIPAAARFLGHPGLRALSIKGRANYMCERRVAVALSEGLEPSIFSEDRLAYAVLAACARTRPHGEIGTLPAALLRRFGPLRDLLRRSVTARPEQCSREQCSQNPTCPFGRKRAALGRAELVVANHDLLLRWPPDYPRLTRCIVDEVHELAGVADEVYALDVRPDDLLDRLDDVFGRPGERRASNALLGGAKRRKLAKDASAWRRGLRQELIALGRSLGPLANEFGEVDVPSDPGAPFEAARVCGEAAAGRLEEIAREIDRAADAPSEDTKGSPSLERATGEMRLAATGLRKALVDGGDDAVASFRGIQPPFDRWRLSLHEVSLEASFHDGFLDRLESFAGVSASVFVGDSAFAALGELGVEARTHDRLTRVVEPSPFPYAEHMRVAALEPDAGLVEATAAVLEVLALRLGGRTLGLFTSLARMHDVAAILAPRLRPHGIELFLPRRASDDPRALVERFRRDAGVLLGARKFWQGLDIPGEALQAVVIEKLPFEVPSELRRRREALLRAEGVDVFRQYTLGKMLLNLKQMTGRLIRSESDRGIVVIVEGRTRKPYFRRLREALPPDCRVEAVGMDDFDRLLAEVGIGRMGTATGGGPDG